MSADWPIFRQIALAESSGISPATRNVQNEIAVENALVRTLASPTWALLSRARQPEEARSLEAKIRMASALAEQETHTGMPVTRKWQVSAPSGGT
ncbi:hypothetical protein KUV26_16410 [Leisingera daeponensis]|uniref:Uncharacterized protein n=1 Tax=Leisingera daeponensis TaxID=405746 RepID=A0ABS7NK09_9RHOB|nr:hypothetical protein [Leisingera daeponensis]MBY6141024.1 hypothetical protein [Leisingera daeponensis]